MFALCAILKLERKAVDLRLQTKISTARSYYNKDSGAPYEKNMIDPERVLSFEDMRKMIKQPEKVIIDVRNPDEVQSTGKIPSSINIPLTNMQDTLVSMPDDEFRKLYNRHKPKPSDELIFYCRSGKRSTEALDKALKLGYTKSKTYLGSWDEWSTKHRDE